MDDYNRTLRHKFEHLQRLYYQARQPGAVKPTPSPSPTVRRKLCWLCGMNTAYVSYTGNYDLCYSCVRDTLLCIVLPPLQKLFGPADSALVKAIEAYEKIEPTMPAVSPIASPRTEAQGWHCIRCTLENSAFDTLCTACGSPRQEVMCRYCCRDALQYRMCRATGQLHETWICEECSKASIGDAIVCDGCWANRPWYCGNCSLKNYYPSKECSACRGEGRLNSLGSFAARRDLQEAGISVDETEKEKKRNAEIETHEQRLKDRLSSIGAKSVKINNDGNCLFRALAHQLCRDEELFPLIRRMIVDYMEDNAAEYKAYIGTEEFADYIEKMRLDKTWGDEYTLQAASRLFGTCLHVITSEKVRWHLRYKPWDVPHETRLHATRHIFLAYVSPVHYYCFTGVTSPNVPPFDLEEELGVAMPSPSSSTSGTPTSTLTRPLSQANLMQSTTQRMDAPSTLKPNKIHRLHHPVVTILRLGTSSMNLVVSQQIIQVSRTASKFYLHPLPTQPKPFDNLFLLQCVSTGLFVAPAPRRPGASPDRLRLLQLSPLGDDVTPFACKIDERTDSLGFPYHGVHVAYQGEAVFVTDDKQQPLAGSFMGSTQSRVSPLLIVLLYGGRPERYCVRCMQWYDVSVPPADSGCRHESYCEVGGSAIRKSIRR